MATLEELQNQKSLLDKLSGYFSKTSEITTILLGIFCIVIGMICWKGSIFQNIIFCIAVAFFVINIYLLLLSKKGKNIPTVFSSSRWLLSISLILISIIVSIIDKNHSILMPCLIVFLCMANAFISRKFSKKWNMPDLLLDKILTNQKLGILIAALQLVIAYPQLQLAYKSVSSDEITLFRENIQQFNAHIESFVFVDIPDSLIDENVKTARNFQKQLYTYSLFIVNANWERDISINTYDIDSVMQTPQFKNDKNYNQLRIKKNQSLLNDYIFNMLAPQRMSSVTERILANNKGTQRLTETLKRIYDYYSISADSTLLMSQIDQRVMENTLSSQGKLTKLLEQSLSQLETTSLNIKRTNENNVLDIYNKQKIIKEELIGFQSVYNQYLLNPAFNDYIKGMDAMCVDFIAFLNLIQLKYAYNVDLDLNRD